MGQQLQSRGIALLAQGGSKFKPYKDTPQYQTKTTSHVEPWSFLPPAVVSAAHLAGFTTFGEDQCGSPNRRGLTGGPVGNALLFSEARQLGRLFFLRLCCCVRVTSTRVSESSVLTPPTQSQGALLRWSGEEDDRGYLQ